MTEPVVSIVIVTWEARDFTLRCLASLQEHVKIPYEVIVVDDGSTDGTVEAVRAQFADARVHPRTVNGGLVAGRNDALRMVRGRIVFMLDSDTLVHDGTVETLVE